MEDTGDVNGSVENAVETLHLKRKQHDCSSQPDSYNVLEAPAMFISQKNDWPDQPSSLRSPEMFTEIEGRILMRCANYRDGSERLQSSPLIKNDAGLIVEELTLKNYNTSNSSIVGCSNNREDIPLKKGQWQNLYQLVGHSRNGSSHGDMISKEPMMLGASEDVENMSHPKYWIHKPPPSNHSHKDNADIPKHLNDSHNCTVSGNTFTRSPEGVRTKVLPVSGFPQFFIKNSLKGKGAVYKYSTNHKVSGPLIHSQKNAQVVCDAQIGSGTSQCSTVKADEFSQRSVGGIGPVLSNDGISLREWLKPGRRKLNKIESLHIFKQILELVDRAHSQGVALQDLRPSCFIVFPSEKVKYVRSWDPQIQMEMSQTLIYQEVHELDHHMTRKRYLDEGMDVPTCSSVKQRTVGEHIKFAGQCPRLSAGCRSKSEIVEAEDTNPFKAQNSGRDFRERANLDKNSKSLNISGCPGLSNYLHPQMNNESMQLEERWYASPEELNDRVCTFSSNIYNLGVLVFELFCCFETLELHAAAMSDLRYRILPSSFLSENPTVAGFCLWLLHPEPSSRPKTREILESELLFEAQDMSSRDQLSLSVNEEDAESELLLHFLVSLKEQKQKQAARLVENLGCLKADIEEVERRHSLRTEFLSQTDEGSHAKDSLTRFNDISDEYNHRNTLEPELPSRSCISRMNETGLMRNIIQLENAYFSMRSKIVLPESEASSRSDKDVLKSRERVSAVQNDNDGWCTNEKPTDHLGAFFDGVCKYARCSKFEVCGTLRNADLLNSANVICSLSFDRDEDYFAAAGVSRKIKIFEFGSLLNDTVDIHYPVIEMSSKSKLSCVCWNSYIKNYLASTDYDGVVQLWDASTGQGFLQYKEHQKRAWSVDFSQVDPTKLASGSDDCSVKLWSINEENSISTIRNVANVCCVQFSSCSPHLLAFGSADYKIYCYDLRNTRIPWCTLAGHGKAVSYVKFLDPYTLVSASTDNTLRLWDLNKTADSGPSTSACNLTLSGHTNEKNFVGLSVSDGYIACGSETNEVYSYYRSLPMPITSHKFGSVDPITGQETGDDNGQFVSSVCWRRKSNVVVAANSNGSIKLLKLV